jgi:hypothetical protein
MSKWIKSAEVGLENYNIANSFKFQSISRAEILLTMSKMVHGVGATAYPRHREIFKLISKNSLTDRVMFVRVAAVKVCFSIFYKDKSFLVSSRFVQ